MPATLKIFISSLRRRFIFMGILNFIFAPFIVLYLIMYSFFRYFEVGYPSSLPCSCANCISQEYRKNPSSIGGRRYTRYAQWKFREFNELAHLFERRLDESYPAASMYIGQYPNEKLTLIMRSVFDFVCYICQLTHRRFVAFIAGSFAAVLVLASVVDPDLFLHFEITPHHTVFFYIGVFGSVLAVAQGMIPNENRVFDPELLMMEVITYTHYMPDTWKGQLHSKMVSSSRFVTLPDLNILWKVHQEFGQLFAMKIMIFVQELLSVVLTPFVLWLSLPACAPALIDFFRNFSVHVDGRGYVCSFAEFNFQRHGNVKVGKSELFD
jgi:autophagy-related protein 9